MLISGHRRSSSYGSSSDKLYGPYQHHGGGAGNNVGVMGGMGGGGAMGQYLPAPSIYTSYAHPHQQNPYAHLPLFPQVCAQQCDPFPAKIVPLFKTDSFGNISLCYLM